MKILLDENLPVELKNEFNEDSLNVFSVKDMGWEGIKNGELLKKLESDDFEVFITMDKNLEKQQNISKFQISIFVLDAYNNKIQTLKPYISKVKEILRAEFGKGINKVKI